MALTSARLPEISIELVPPPVTAAAPVAVKVPLPPATETVVVTVALSASATAIPVIASAWPSTAAWAPGTVLTGAASTWTVKPAAVEVAPEPESLIVKSNVCAPPSVALYCRARMKSATRAGVASTVSKMITRGPVP